VRVRRLQRAGCWLFLPLRWRARARNRTALALTTPHHRRSRAAALRTRDGLALLDAPLSRRLAAQRTRLARLLRCVDADVEAFESALDEHLAASDGGRSLAGARRGEELTREVRPVRRAHVCACARARKAAVLMCFCVRALILSAGGVGGGACAVRGARR
jgi:hypothetical protein